MSWKRTILAVVIFILMVMAYVLDSTIIGRMRIQAVREASLTDSVNVSDVGQVIVKNAQGSVTLVRTPNGWRITAPMDVPADPEIVDTMLINVTSARRRNDSEAKNLAEYGLANPDVELTLIPLSGKQFGAWGQKFQLHLGHKSTYTGQVFGRYPSQNEVFTVGEHVKNSLMRSPNDLRKSRILDINPGELEQYSRYSLAASNGQNVTLQNKGGEWQISEPFEGAAEPTVVRDYFTKLGLLRASHFLSQTSDRPTSMAAALQALSSPTLTLTLEQAGAGAKQELLIGLAEGVDGPTYVAQRPGEPEIMVLADETVEDLRRGGQFFRSRDLFNIKPDDAGLLTVQIGMAPATALIKNDQGAWELVGDPEFRVNQDMIGARVDELLTLRVKDYITPNPTDVSIYGLDNPRARYTIVSKDKTLTEVLETGSDEEGNPGVVYARRSGDPSIFTVQRSPELLFLTEQIADKRFAAIDLQKLVRIEADVDDETYELKLENGEWKLMKPTQSTYSTVDMRQMQTLQMFINGMEYFRDVSSSGNVVVGAKQGPPLELRFYGENDTVLGEFNVGTRVNNRVTVVGNGRGRNYEVANNIVDRLYALVKAMVQ